MKRLLLCAPLLFLVGCSDVLHDTALTANEAGHYTPQPINMMFIGTAKTDDVKDPINQCRVYAFKLESYIQTAMICPNGTVTTTASAGHQKSDDDSSDAALAAN